MKKLLLLIIFLAGCNMHTARHQSQCAEYGFTPGTNEYANCLMTLDQNQKQRTAEAWQNIEFKNPYENAHKNYDSINCKSRKVGDTVYTDCD